MENIIFNGQHIPAGIRLVSYTIDSPTVKFRTLDLPERRGLVRAGKKYGERYVRLTVKLWDDRFEDEAAALAALNAWCVSDGPAELHLPGVEGRHLMAECSGFPAPTQNAERDGTADIEFTSHEPAWLEDVRSVGFIGQAFRIGGMLPVSISLEGSYAASVVDPVITIDGESWISISGTLEAGTIEIDTALGRVLSNGEDISNMVSIESDIDLMLLHGEHTIGGDALTGMVYWRNAWL